jgi:hypothetical protein
MNNSLFDISAYEKPKPKKKRVNRKNLALDFIYTDSIAHGLCCMAVSAGLKYGAQSGSGKICKYADEKWHKLTFLDLDFKNYDHSVHIEKVKKWKPKYTSVRDIMTKEQCAALNIQWFDPKQILDWAEEASEYAENVIVIPKYLDAFEDIPDKFMLGALMGSGYSKTDPLPLDLYIGRRVHILGGSWKRQIAKIEECLELGVNVVSLDNNNLSKIAIYGSFNYPDGTIGKIKENLGFNDLTNHWHVACCISFGNIAAKINEMFSGGNDVKKNKVEHK